MPRVYGRVRARSAASSSATTATCRTSSSPSSAASCGCCRRATPSARAQAAIRIAVDLARGEAHHARRRRCSASRPSRSTSSSTRSSTPRRGARRKDAGDADRDRPERLAGRGRRPRSRSTPTPPSAGRKEEKQRVIMVRPETKPDDVHGMLAAQGILTSRGGRTSHAALVARQFGKPAVVGVLALEIDLDARAADALGGRVLQGGRLDLDRRHHRRGLRRRAADRRARRRRPVPAQAARVGRRASAASASGPTPTTRATPSGRARFGAEGIGLCRTEHMFFETERLPIVQRMILAPNDSERARGTSRSCCRSSARTSTGLFRAMDGLPVTIRLIDPPLHEFLPEPRRAACTTVDRARDAHRSLERRRRRGARARTLAAKRRLLDARRGAARAEPDARPARRAPRHPHAGADAHAGARDLRGGLRVRAARASRCNPKIMIPLAATSERAQGRARAARGGGAGR